MRVKEGEKQKRNREGDAESMDEGKLQKEREEERREK